MNEIKNYEQACQNIADKINELYFDGNQAIDWIGNMVGGICTMGDWFLDLDFMVTALRYGATEDQFFKYYDLMLNEATDVNFKNYIKLNK